MEGKAEKHSREVRTWKGLQTIVIILLSTFVCVRCSRVAHIHPESIADPGRSNLSDDRESGVNHPPILYMGSKFIYQDISLLDGKVSRVTMEVKERERVWT